MNSKRPLVLSIAFLQVMLLWIRELHISSTFPSTSLHKTYYLSSFLSVKFPNAGIARTPRFYPFHWYFLAVFSIFTFLLQPWTSTCLLGNWRSVKCWLWLAKGLQSYHISFFSRALFFWIHELHISSTTPSYLIYLSLISHLSLPLPHCTRPSI